MLLQSVRREAIDKERAVDLQRGLVTCDNNRNIKREWVRYNSRKAGLC